MWQKGERKKTRAGTILQQLGGQRFAAVTGSKDFTSDDNALHMTLAKNKSGANKLSVTLDADDTYTMCFFKYTASMKMIPECLSEIEIYQDVYYDHLQDIFEAVTGIDLSMCRVFFG